MILLNWVIDGCEKPMVCLLPFKANTAKQSHGAGRGGAGGGEDGQAGRQTDGWPLPPPPNPNSQAATNQTQRRRRATTPTVLWLALMGLNLQQKVVAWLSIAFFCSLVLIEGGGEGDWRKMRTEGGGKKLLGDKRCSNKPTMKNMKQTTWFAWGGRERGWGQISTYKN